MAAACRWKSIHQQFRGHGNEQRHMGNNLVGAVPGARWAAGRGWRRSCGQGGPGGLASSRSRKEHEQGNLRAPSGPQRPKDKRTSRMRLSTLWCGKEVKKGKNKSHLGSWSLSTCLSLLSVNLAGLWCQVLGHTGLDVVKYCVGVTAI